MRNKTLGIVITDGVGYRNFILSTFLAKAKMSFSQITIFSGLPASAYPELDEAVFKIVELPVFTENKLNWYWRKAKEVAHLQKYKENPGIKDNLNMNRKKGWSPNSVLVKSIYAFTRFLHSENWIEKYERLQEKSFAKSEVVKNYKEFLEENPVDLLFFTHQRPPFISALVYCAKALKIPTSAFIFSWDNLASKGRMAAKFDYFLVWSDLMKSELLRFYENVTEDKVSVVGTPQFEPYVLDEFSLEKETFLRKFGLDPNKKIICYSCADKSIGPNDPLVIKTIAEAVENGVLENCQLLVRTSPAEDESRFLPTKQAYPSIKWNHPVWHLTRENHPEPWSQRVATKDDISDLKSILQFCDINVNMCSTMSLDFMLYDKAVVNTVFGNKENGLYDDQRFLNYEHYDNVVKSGAVVIAKTENELLDALNAYLENPSLDAENRKKLIDLQIGQPLEKTTQACVNALADVIN
ncbi:MAG: hypothetical protein CL868_17320 [Cytophagaceae bacterium]|nr:hypothetical protein [Cytophagaceae bacterium]